MTKLKTWLFAAAACLAPATGAHAQFQHGPPPPTSTPTPAPRTRPPATTAVEGVTVTGARPDFRSSIDRRSYSVADDLQSTTGSIADALRNLPSVEVDLEGNVSLRGDSNVTILVDGRPSGMFEGEGRGDALQNLPADQIDRVEVMTNPSAAFRPDGSAGIINLVTRKKQLPGRSGSVRANVGTDGRYNGGVSGAYSAGKLTLSGDASYRREHQEGGTESVRESLDPASGAFLESRQSTATLGKGDMFNLRGSADYDIDPTLRLSGEVRRRSMEFAGTSTENYESDDATGALVSAYGREAENTFERSNTEGRLGLVKRFPGEEHELSLNLRAEHSEGERDSLAAISNLLPAAPMAFEDIRVGNTQDRIELKTDYNRPMDGGARLKLGYEVERTENDYDNYAARGPSPDALVVNPFLTNRFLYDQTLLGIYGTYERPIGPVTAQFGLRLEQVDIAINQITGGIRASNDYFRAYPTLHLGWDVGENQQFTASYSKRVQRPRSDDLNPFIVYVDPFNLRQGNPFLEPQETQSYEIGWQYRAGRSYYLATLYYRDTSKSITDVVSDLGAGVLLTTKANLGESRSGGLELVANGKLTSTLSYNVSSNLYWNEINASNLGFNETRSGFSASGRASLNWQPTAKDFFQINGFVSGERLQAQGVREPSGMLNLGYRRKIDDRLTLVLTAQDVLETFKDSTVIDTPDLRDQTVRRMHAGRAMFIGLTYSFGGGKQREPGFEFDAGEGPG